MMMPAKTIEINVHHLTRVEGHGNIVVRARDGVIEKVAWQVPEAPRFFEAMVRGRNWDDIQTIVSRICGICSVSHSLAAIKAVENALGVEVSEQTARLRLLAHYAEQIESHVLHAGYLVAPDLLGQKSVVPLVASHPELVKTVIALHRLGNQWMELICGRMTHPVTFKPGGFSALPAAADLQDLQRRIQAALPQLDQLARAILAAAGRLPDFRRPTEYVALVDGQNYTFYDGDIGSTDAKTTLPVGRFEEAVNEYVSPQSTAKWARWHRESYAVGALARFNLNGARLKPAAAGTARLFGMQPGCSNPYFNTVAQVVECVQVCEHAVELIAEILSAGVRAETPRAAPRAGEGAAAVEAPRGILFHRYEFDARGVCRRANLCIPSNQNHANIQKDFEAWVPQIIDRPPDEVRLLLEMLVRAYDPCVSCSTHLLDVRFV